MNGTALYRPSCHTDCVLSGDSTVSLSGMTWSSWTAEAAVGTGTEILNGCLPNCAEGTLYQVPVVATFSHPVKACSSSGARWFFSRASFAYTKGLPTALRGANAPQNPWIFSPLISAAQQSC